MDAIRVPKVEHVTCTKGGQLSTGTLHLTAHHLIFRHDEGEEMLPSNLQGQTPLTLRTRTFETFTLTFTTESDALDVFDSVKELTVATSVTQLYAFFYSPNPPFAANDGWSFYSPREEFGRMGVGTRTKAWRFTDVNKDYSFCPTYPARLVVPTRISDTTLQYASKYRSKCRIPALAYLHWGNYGTITRSSQPMVGLTQSRSVQDEKLIEAIFQSHHNPESRVAPGPVYGATSTNIIIDARPTTNALANSAKGAGTENMDHYKEARKAYLGIDNIHVMRDSLSKVAEALFESAATGNEASGAIVPPLDRQALRRSGWLRHISAILEGTVLIVRNIHVNSSHVLVHCSDGWDRTAQLSSLAQLCLDPYYRTVRGFQVLIEKDWMSFGHKFLDRCGHLSSEKFFLSPVENSGGGGGAEAAQAFFASVQNRFVGQSHLKETSPVFHQFLESVRQIQRQFPERFEFNERFLRQLHYHLYSCQFGTFLFNSERERRTAEQGPPPCDRTASIWDFLNSPPENELNLNPLYDRSLDDPKSRAAKADMGVLFPNTKDVKFWNELYGRTDDEMNGRIVIGQAQNLELVGPVDDSSDDSVTRALTPSSAPLSPGTPSRTSTPSLSVSELKNTEASLSSTEDLNGSRHTASTSETSYKPYPSSASAYTLRRPVDSVPRSPSPANGGRRTTGMPDVLGAGVKSVWGRFSSNASAALSAVQGAYDGVAKDFRTLSISPSAGELREKELQSPEQWTTSIPSPDYAAGPSTAKVPTATTASTPSSNPWNTESIVRVPSMALDNPWGSVRSPPADSLSSSGHPALDELPLFDPLPPPSSERAGISNLPISQPGSRPQLQPSSQGPSSKPIVAQEVPTISSTTSPNLSRGTTSVTSPGLNETPRAADSDPLGVGFS
ncbi:phosphotyrosine protein [Punctularia strigosozonata HHB-11173 SS5]|uniref:phosphotyrosine protein n=1 Tax=Punctularia strigosozonata (strain HHB-11173) TaxID=741275 RepID=UPI0004416FBD|nr:phosphotyrosine protein [Punctularia strigosozonata HHB-11173 SS5]EIN07202.1 phosphotyrosine protein [Punctularia strigosozonata HHB-11173 SS5]